MGIVSFRPYGRLGNFLFMAANCTAYAMKHGMEFSMPYKTNDNYWNPIYLSHLIHPDYKQGREDILINENGMAFKEIEWEEYWRDKYVILNGYYQSYKYINPYRNEILYLFDIPYEKKELVSIHVRRGDYVLLRNKHPEVTKQWYEQAMSMFPGKRFKFFSDEIKWCKDNFGDREDCEFSTNVTEWDDLVEISWCEHQVNSSSTFSWWGAWLNQNPEKKIITPKLWFTEGWDNLDTSDIVPEEWIKL